VEDEGCQHSGRSFLANLARSSPYFHQPNQVAFDRDGPVWFLVSAAGLAISRHSVNGIGYANALMAVIVGGWSFALGRDRLLPLWRVLYSLFLAALVVAPYALGNSPLKIEGRSKLLLS
jgi:hypothetical protein